MGPKKPYVIEAQAEERLRSLGVYRKAKCEVVEPASGGTLACLVKKARVVRNIEFTGLAPGNATITATSEGKSGSATVTVTSPPVNRIVVTPSFSEKACSSTSAGPDGKAIGRLTSE